MIYRFFFCNKTQRGKLFHNVGKSDNKKSPLKVIYISGGTTDIAVEPILNALYSLLSRYGTIIGRIETIQEQLSVAIRPEKANRAFMV